MTYEEEVWVETIRELTKTPNCNPVDNSGDAFFLLIKYRLFGDSRFWNWFEYYMDLGKSDIEAARVAVTRVVAESVQKPPS